MKVFSLPGLNGRANFLLAGSEPAWLVLLKLRSSVPHCISLIYDVKKKVEEFFCIVYQSFVAETKPIPVRLSGDIIGRLDAAAKRIGNNRAGVIRFLVDSWLLDFEKKGVASLPPNWEKIIASTDNRTRESRIESNSNVDKNSAVSDQAADTLRKHRKKKFGS